MPSYFNPFKSSIVSYETRIHDADQDQMPQYELSAQDLHCLLTTFSIKFNTDKSENIPTNDP